jgi:glycosyltransferase involved in cell wall biosynthesis
MKRYLFIMVQEGYRWGGSEPLWSSAAEHLVRQGNEVRVCAKDWGEPVPQIERLRPVGCRIILRPDRFAIPPFFARQVRRVFPSPPYFESQIRSMGRDADLVVISQTDNADGLEWMEAARAAGLRYVAIAQSAVVYWWPEDARAERVARCYEHAAASYFVSQAVLDITRCQFGSQFPNAEVVPQQFGIPYDVSPPWPGDAEQCLRLAHVGRLDVVSKAQDILLQVLALPHWRRRNVRLSLFGTGPHEGCLRRMVQEFSLNNVDFAGQTDDVPTVWAKHHALVLPSRFEGMPLVVIEAMLCGRCCIVTDVGGNRELICDGLNGFLAKAPTVELFDDAMNRAWENRSRLREMGEAAARDIRKLVPPDPGRELARELDLLARDDNRGERTSAVEPAGATR